MSTWMYLVCEAHDPPVKADEESGQHHYDLPQIRFDWMRRGHWLPYIDRFPGTLSREFDHLSYFQRHTFAFLIEHQGCERAPAIESEYGERFPLEVDNIAALLDQG